MFRGCLALSGSDPISNVICCPAPRFKLLQKLEYVGTTDVEGVFVRAGPGPNLVLQEKDDVKSVILLKFSDCPFHIIWLTYKTIKLFFGLIFVQ